MSDGIDALAFAASFLFRRQGSQQEHFCSLACVRYSVSGGEALFEVTRKTIATPYSRFFKQRRLGESEAERKN